MCLSVSNKYHSNYKITLFQFLGSRDLGKCSIPNKIANPTEDNLQK